MATESPLIHDGSQTTAATDLSASQFYAVKIVGVRSVGLANAGGEAIYGVLQNKPGPAQACDVGLFGVSKAAVGAAVVAGSYLSTDNTGRFIDAAGTGHRGAQALETATAAGQIITVVLGVNSGDTTA